MHKCLRKRVYQNCGHLKRHLLPSFAQCYGSHALPRPECSMNSIEPLDANKTAFIELLLESEVLCFGDFITKAGFKTPYFLNFGKFSTGSALAGLGRAYAEKIIRWDIEFDMLFGAAYKGIPIATVTATALAEQYGRSVPVGFDRKEAKDHGEGGDGLGAPLAGRVLLLDDVISAGTTAREMLDRTHRFGATFAGMLIGVDRQDRLIRPGTTSLEAISSEIQVPIMSLVTRSDIQAFLELDPKWHTQAARLKASEIQ